MRTALLLMMSWVAPVALFAQGWAGLPFGRSAAHVRDVLSRQPPVCTVLTTQDDHDCTGLAMEPLPTEGDYTVKPQLELWLGALNEPLHFHTLLHFFDADRQLARVDLTLDSERYKVEGKSPAQLVAYAGDPVLNDLLGKYGIPLTISPACESSEAHRILRTQPAVIECSAVWKSQGGQMVNLMWKYTPVSYVLTVRYTGLLSGF